MKKINIKFNADLFKINSWLPKKFNKFHIVIITEHKIKNLYGQHLKNILIQFHYKASIISVTGGEHNKNSKTKTTIENKMLQLGLNKQTLILALGGGVMGDIAGFIAGTYYRGIPYIQIPTTLLAMIDSSIGGKTAINTSYGKNLIGLIYQPEAVVIDYQLLKSLAKKHILNGLIEAIKIFLLYDAPSFFAIEKYLDRILENDISLLKKFIVKAVQLKATVVKRDEKELGERALLNFGHTIGHALEKISGYKILHGFAVAYGILVESNISYLACHLDYKSLKIIHALFFKLGFELKDLNQYSISSIIKATLHDKKVKNNQPRYVLLKKIGKAYTINKYFVHEVSTATIKTALER